MLKAETYDMCNCYIFPEGIKVAYTLSGSVYISVIELNCKNNKLLTLMECGRLMLITMKNVTSNGI